MKCSECEGTQETGCICEEGEIRDPGIQDMLLLDKLNHETDDEYDVGKDW